MTSGTGLASLNSRPPSMLAEGAKEFEDGVVEFCGGETVVEET